MRSLNVDLTRKELRKLALLQLAGDAVIMESTHGKINRRLEQSILISPLCNVAMTVTLNSDSYFAPAAIRASARSTTQRRSSIRSMHAGYPDRCVMGR